MSGPVYCGIISDKHCRHGQICPLIIISSGRNDWFMERHINNPLCHDFNWNYEKKIVPWYKSVLKLKWHTEATMKWAEKIL